MEFNFQGVWRMDWGLGNPNITAALIVTLLVGVWILAFFHRKGFWFSLPLFTVLEICLIHTMSRGGLLAAFASLGVLAWFAPRPWPKARWISLLAAFWIGVLFTVYINAHERFGQGMIQEDKSISNRLVIWKMAPRMLADAPGGWGVNQVGEAYMAWYQDANRHEFYGSLVNTHLTKLVELGVLGGILYLFAWVLAIWICWPDRNARWRAVPLGILVGFGVAASFTNMGREPAVWVVPGLAVLLTAGFRVWKRESLSFKPLVAGGALVLLGIGIVYGTGMAIGGPRISASAKSVLWNGGGSGNWLLVDRNVVGKQYPKTWRMVWEKHPELKDVGLGFALEPGVVPDSMERLVVAGMLPPDLVSRIKTPASARLLLLNPSFDPSLLKDFPKENVEVVAGEFSASASRPEWRRSGKFTLVEGAGEFLALWPAYAAEFIQKKP